MQVSNCCFAPFKVGFIEDGERCSACGEHCGVEEEFKRGNVTITVGELDCWIEIKDKAEYFQSTAVTKDDLRLLHEALGDYLDPKR